MSNVKRVLSVLLIFALLLIPFGSLTGCQKETGPLRVLLDLADTFDSTDQEQAAMQLLLDQIASKGGPQDVELEVIPVETEQRKGAMTRIRTEVMAGEGPDLYIMQCQRDYLGTDLLFQMPEKSMQLGLFYPLDDMMDKAQFMQVEQQTESVMAAGRSDKWGQVILPLTYTFPVTVFRSEDVPEDVSGSHTWEDMVNDQVGYLATSAIWSRAGTGSAGQIDATLGQLADFGTNKLLFTEEDLINRVEENLELCERDQNGEFESLPDFYQTLMRVQFEADNHANQFGTNHYIDGLMSTDALTFVPVYSDDGGITATVTSFGAINANSKRAKDAFYILDYLLSEENQQNSALYKWMTCDLKSIPVQKDLMQPSKPVNGWSMNEETYQAFCEVRDQISFVKFGGFMDFELNYAFGDAFNARLYDMGNKTPEEAAADACRVIQMELDE